MSRYDLGFFITILCLPIAILYYGYRASVLKDDINTEIRDYESHFQSNLKSPHNGENAKNIKTSDPLGQDVRLIKSIPVDSKKAVSMDSKLIRKIQLTLMLDGFYNGKIDAKKTKGFNNAILNYKASHDILGGAEIDELLLISLGLDD